MLSQVYITTYFLFLYFATDISFHFSVDFIVAGKHLAEHCRTEYSRGPNFVLWVLAEIAIVACDIPEGDHKFLKAKQAQFFIAT